MGKTLTYKLYTTSLIPIIFILAILLTRYYGGHVLFHTISEFFSIFVGVMTMIVVSFTYQFTKNNFLLYLGMGYFWVSILDFMHMLTYPGVQTIQAVDSNIMLTFWLAARFLEAFILFSAPFMILHTISKSKVFVCFGLVSISIFFIAFSKYIPILYEEGSGLTSLKINLEYTIIVILILTIFVYVKKKFIFDESIYYYLIASITLTIFAELTLTFYAKVDDSFTVLAHLFKFLSFWMIFLSIIKTSLEKPFKFLAHESSTYNSIPFPSILVDTKGTIRQINNFTPTFLNLKEDKIINQNNHMLFHDQNTKEDDCKVCMAIKEGKTLLSHVLQKDVFTYSCSVNPINIKDLTLGSVQVCIDITTAKKNELALIEDENRFRMLFENSEVSIWSEDLSEVIKYLEELRKTGLTDLHKHLTENIELAQKIAKKVRVIDVNSATLKLFNADSKENFLSGIDLTFSEDSIFVFIDELDAIWNEKESFSKEASFKTLDGKTIRGIVTFQIPKQLDQFSNLSVSIIDITSLKKAENELKLFNYKLEQKKKELETIIKWAPNPIMVHNEDGKVLLVNNVWEELTGYKLKEIDTIEKWTYLAYGERMPIVKEYIDKLYELKLKADEGQYDIITKDGKVIIWQFSSAPLGMIDGKRAVISSAMDITELKHKDEMLINQSRHAAMGEMIGMIAHQWRQPLTSISMVANNMLLDIELENFNITEVEKNAESITEQTQYLSKTINDFSNFFKPDKELIKINIDTILDNTLSIIKDSLKSDNIELITSFETNKRVKAYPRELMQVFVNIINNSKDALISNKLDNALISIRVYEDGKYINTEICDNGGGIKDDILSKVFDPYFSTKDEKNGTGLGLYMSKMIIENHLNGTIQVGNRDEGVCFTVRLLKGEI